MIYFNDAHYLKYHDVKPFQDIQLHNNWNNYVNNFKRVFAIFEN